MDKRTIGWVHTVLDMIEPILSLEKIESLSEVKIIIRIRQKTAKDWTMRINEEAEKKIDPDKEG